ncbi:hypothetical protein NIES4103_30390 [Nostoc sp. NIES-4103]|nr:hypothetical protein NIES4103_30390 [Nostoc sp. NIES-4103]
MTVDVIPGLWNCFETRFSVSIIFIYRFKKKEYLLLSVMQHTLKVIRKNTDRNDANRCKMNPVDKVSSNKIDAEVAQQPHIVEIQQSVTPNVSTELTRGQRLADKLASHVGSWKFLICQSTVLAGWVGMNLMPGVPHWDESPFIMLNLVFSFASAYTAPIVLMSQNRQSDTDRANAEIDHHVNRTAAQNIELLHEKLDKLHSQQLAELTQIVKEQQQIINELRVSLVPAAKENKDIRVTLLPGLHIQTNSKFAKETPGNKSFTVDQPLGDNNKVVEKLTRK